MLIKSIESPNELNHLNQSNLTKELKMNQIELNKTKLK